MAKRIILVFICVLFVFGCEGEKEHIGIFSIRKKDGYTEITDGIGRRLILVKKGAFFPAGYKKYQIINVPVKKVVAYSLYTVALIKELGHIDSVKGVVFEKDVWKELPEIKKGIEKGTIVFLGQSTCIDYEMLKKIEPDVVFSWDEAIVPKLEELGIPCIITSASIAPGLNEHIRFILFLSEFYDERKRAEEFVKEQFKRIDEISKKLRHVKYKPKVIWGDIYPRKVLVEPANSWASEAVKKAKAEYLFDDIQGASCMQITMEKFFSRAKDADILITYRGPESGIKSKKMLIESCPMLKKIKIKPLDKGKIYATRWILWQTADTASIIEELAFLFHPELFPQKKNKYFFKLP